MIRILVTGSREVDAAAERIVCAALAQAVIDAARVDRDIVIVHGAARGVDTVASFWAPPLRVERHPADWERYGKQAGVIRNMGMVDLGADVCLAFPRLGSRGTWHCVRYAADHDIPVRIYPLPRIVQ
jgi:hypothetical protein